MDVLRRLGIDLGLGLLRPLLGLGQPLLQLADAGEVLVELFAVAGAEVRLQLPGLIADRVEDALAVAQPAGLGLALRRDGLRGTAWRTRSTARNPTARAHRCGSRTGRSLRTTGPGWGSASRRRCARPRTGPARCCSEAGPLLRMRGGGQEAVDGIVAGAHVRMRQPGDDREVVAKVLEDLQVRRQLVILAGLLREEIRRMQAQRRADADHAARRLAAAAARAPGASASSQGRASDTPAARRKVRR